MLLFILGAMCGTMLGVAITCCMIISKEGDTNETTNIQQPYRLDPRQRQ